MSQDEVQFLRKVLKILSPKIIISLNWVDLFESLIDKLKFSLNDSNKKKAIKGSFNTKYFRLLLENNGALEPLVLKKLNVSKKQKFFEELMRLYFVQIFCERPFYFNFLEIYFFTNPSADIFYFKPLSGFSNGSLLDKEFKEGLKELYRGLYEKKQKTAIYGLIKMGLLNDIKNIKETSEKDLELKKHYELMNIVSDHFGSNIKQYIFDLKDLSSISEKLIAFVKKNKVKIDSNFIIFSLCLTSLYLILKENKKGINLEKIYYEVKSEAS
ncbi:hypothetical protein OAK75_11795 [Bacteriovoracales bacterium]|nr:hypothetical protein [Bacteriovoracales bacterium]